MSFSPYLAWVLMLNREYCPVERYSVRCPWTVLLKGIAQKLVAVTLPVLVLRKTFSKSTKPPGVKSAPPMRKDSGDSFGLSWGGRAATFTGLLVFSEALTRRPASAEGLGVWPIARHEANMRTLAVCSNLIELLSLSRLS